MEINKGKGGNMRDERDKGSRREETRKCNHKEGMERRGETR